MIKFRDLNADEIEIRVAQCRQNGVQLLLYKNARVDMQILDETVGTENWQREHYECKGNLFCKVGINTNFDNPDKEDRWIWKSDCGAETKTEAEKGEASDSFKRACTNWGIGRELYTSPFIWIGSDECKIEKNDKGAFVCKDKFFVRNIMIADKKIKALEIINGKNVVVFAQGRPKNSTTSNKLKALCDIAREYNVKGQQICSAYGVKKMEEMTDAQIADCMVAIKTNGTI